MQCRDGWDGTSEPGTPCSADFAGLTIVLGGHGDRNVDDTWALRGEVAAKLPVWRMEWNGGMETARIGSAAVGSAVNIDHRRRRAGMLSSVLPKRFGLKPCWRF